MTEIRIALDDDRPPRGRIRLDRSAGRAPEERPFEGWLGLLRALGDVIDGGDQDLLPQR